MCQIGIILSKYDYDDDNELRSDDSDDNDSDPDEITTDCEDTSLKECYERVKKVFEKDNYPIFKFNAFGRILNRKDMSSALVKICKKLCSNSLNINTEFNLKWSIKNYDKKQQDSYLDSLIRYHYQKSFGNCELGYPLNNIDSCSRPSYCGCSSKCGCVCHYHGNCSNGYPKTNKSCVNQSCKYHNKDECIYGISKTDQKAKCQPTCHYHKNSQIGIIFKKINDKKIFDAIIKFAQILTDKELKDFFNEMKIPCTVTYSQHHHYTFFSMLSCSNFFENYLVDNYSESYDITKNSKIIYMRLINVAFVDNIIMERNLFTLVQNKIIAWDSSIKTHFPKISDIAFGFGNNRMVSLRESWIDKVSTIRKELWNETDVDIHMVIMNVWNHGGLITVFSPLPK